MAGAAGNLHRPLMRPRSAFVDCNSFTGPPGRRDTGLWCDPAKSPDDGLGSCGLELETILGSPVGPVSVGDVRGRWRGRTTLAGPKRSGASSSYECRLLEASHRRQCALSAGRIAPLPLFTVKPKRRCQLRSPGPTGELRQRLARPRRRFDRGAGAKRRLVHPWRLRRDRHRGR
jgi:hypothetical protein